MTKFVEIEMIKIWKEKRYLSIIITLTVFFILSFFITYYAPSDNDNLLLYYYHIFAVNSKILFPISITVFLGTIITSEYRNKTINLLWGSEFSKGEVFLGKFICGIIYIVIILISFISIYMLISGLFFAKPSDIQTKTTIIYKSELIRRSIILLIAEITYLVCFASFICLISVVTKKQVITFIISVSTILLYSFIPIPSSISEFIFLNGSRMHSALALEGFPYLDILKTCFINITTMNIFLLIGTLISDKQ